MVVYTNSSPLYSKKKGMLAKKLVYAPCFWIKDQFTLKMGDGDKYQIPTKRAAGNPTALKSSSLAAAQNRKRESGTWPYFSTRLSKKLWIR